MRLALPSPLVLILSSALLGVVAVSGAALVQRHRWADPKYGLKKGDDAIERKQWNEVDDIVTRLELGGFSNQAQLLRGKKWLARDDVPRAVDCFARITSNSPVGTEAMTLEASCYYQLGRLDKAQRVYVELIARSPDNAAAHWGLAVVYFSIFAWDDSLTECREAARCDDGDGRPHGHQGLIYKHLKQPQKAAACFRAALERSLSDHRRGEIQEDLAEVLIDRNDFAAAQKLLDDLPDDADPALRVKLQARCDWELKSHDAAVLSLEKGLQPLVQHASPNAADQSMIDAELLLCRFLLETKQENLALEVLQGVYPRQRSNFEANDLLLKAFQALKMEKEEQEQRKVVQAIEKIRPELDELESKAYQDRTDVASRNRVAELWRKLGRDDLAELWRNAAIAAVST